MANATFQTDTLHEESLEHLIMLRDAVDEAIETKKATAKSELIAEFEKKAASLGLDLSELIGKKSKQSRSKVAPKYQSDRNPTEQWTGRGRQPKWLTARLEAGKKLEDLLIAS